MKKRIHLVLLWVATLLFHLDAQAQELKHIKGKVLNAETYEPIPYASIKVVGAQGDSGTSTNDQGENSFRVPAGSEKLRISSVGFGTEEYPIGEGTQQTIRVQLFPSNS